MHREVLVRIFIPNRPSSFALVVFRACGPWASVPPYSFDPVHPAVHKADAYVLPNQEEKRPTVPNPQNNSIGSISAIAHESLIPFYKNRHVVTAQSHIPIRSNRDAPCTRL